VLAAGRPVETFPEQVGVTVVPGVLGDQMDVDQPALLEVDREVQ
jgi:hypothetical protein